jgi:hypothetical protein
MTVAIVFLRWEGGILGGEHSWREWQEGEEWPPPPRAWFTRSKKGEGYDLWLPRPDGGKPKALNGFVVDPYRRVRSAEPSTAEVYDP